MTRTCLRINCEEPAWEHENLQDVDGNPARSHFCLKHAWAAVRGHLLFTKPQWDVYRTFNDFLVPEECGMGVRAYDPNARWYNFPEEWVRIKALEHGSFRVTGQERICFRCAKDIVSGSRYCGKCAKHLGVEIDTPLEEELIECEHWREEPEPGHLWYTHCRRKFYHGHAVDVNGQKWCPLCYADVMKQSRVDRLRQGYDF